MKDDILKIIEANLPKQVGETLQARLALVDELEKENEQLKIKNSKLLEQNNSLNNEIEEGRELHAEALALKEAIEDKAIKLEARERNIDLEKSKQSESEADRRANDLFNLVSLVFKSPVYKTHISKDMDYQDQYTDGKYELKKTRENTTISVEEDE